MEISLPSEVGLVSTADGEVTFTLRLLKITSLSQIQLLCIEMNVGLNIIRTSRYSSDFLAAFGLLPNFSASVTKLKKWSARYLGSS